MGNKKFDPENRPVNFEFTSARFCDDHCCNFLIPDFLFFIFLLK